MVGTRFRTGQTEPAAGGGRAAFAVPQNRASRLVLARAGFAGWFQRFSEEQKKHRSFWHWLFVKIVDTRTETLRETNTYMLSCAWLRPHMTGWLREVIKWENIIFLVVMTPFRGLGIGMVKATERQSRFWLVFLAALIAFVIYVSAHH
jgi:hypothetical protein